MYLDQFTDRVKLEVGSTSKIFVFENSGGKGTNVEITELERWLETKSSGKEKDEVLRGSEDV